MSRKDTPQTVQKAVEIAYGMRKWVLYDPETIDRRISENAADIDVIEGILPTKQDVLTFDSVPTGGSANPVTSGGVYDAISDQEALIGVVVTVPQADYENLISGKAASTVRFSVLQSDANVAAFCTRVRIIAVVTSIGFRIGSFRNSRPGDPVYRMIPYANAVGQSMASFVGGVVTVDSVSNRIVDATVSMATSYGAKELPSSEGEYVLEYDVSASGEATARWTELEDRIKAYVDQRVFKAYKHRGSVADYAHLPANPADGDVYTVLAADPSHGIDAGEQVVWSDGAWHDMGGVFDTTALEAQIAALQPTWITDATSTSVAHTFADNVEKSYAAAGSLISLTVPAGIAQGFLSSVVIASVPAGTQVAITNLSGYPMRIIRNREVISSYTAMYDGKKTIFCHFDGISVDIVVVEERDVR